MGEDGFLGKLFKSLQSFVKMSTVLMSNRDDVLVSNKDQADLCVS